MDRLRGGGGGEMPAAAGLMPWNGAGEGSVQVPDRAAARALVAGVLRPGDVVLVKASRSFGLEVLAEQLLAGGDA